MYYYYYKQRWKPDNPSTLSIDSECLVIHIRRQTVSLSQNENTPRWVIVGNVGGLETPPIKRFNTLCATSGQLFITQLLHDEYYLSSTYSDLPNNRAANLINFSGKKHLPTRFI